MNFVGKTVFACAKCAAIPLLTLFLVACDGGTNTNAASFEPVAEQSSSSVIPDPFGDLLSSSNLVNLSSSSVFQSPSTSSGLAPQSVASNGSSSSMGVKTSSSSGEKDFLTLIKENPIECGDESGYSYIENKGILYRLQCINGILVYSPESSSSAESSSSYFDMSKQFNDKISYGEFTDPRDGQVYKTITYEAKIYHRKFVVMASNLNYGKMVPVKDATNADGVVEKFCYNDDPWYCENGFGGLYSWSEAMGFHRACDTVFVGSTAECPDSNNLGEDGRIQGICPVGCHVMNEYEWRIMPFEDFGDWYVLSRVFDGDDNVGFSALLGGVKDLVGTNVTFGWIGEYGFFWLPEENSKIGANAVSLTHSKVDFSGKWGKTGKVSVRCVKDYVVEK